MRDIIKAIEAAGWYQVRQRGSHRSFQHDQGPGIVVVSGHPGSDVKPGTLAAIKRQAGIK